MYVTDRLTYFDTFLRVLNLQRSKVTVVVVVVVGVVTDVTRSNISSTIHSSSSSQ